MPRQSKDPFAVALGRITRELQATHKFTDEEAAARVGISVQRWRRRTEGLHSPSIMDLDKIATAFGIRLPEFVQKYFEYKDEEEGPPAPH